jgi:hypothetical protein
MSLPSRSIFFEFLEAESKFDVRALAKGEGHL